MKSKNESIISETEGKIKNAKFLVLADYRGLNANEINLLRRKLKQNMSELKVIKNTFSSILFKKIGIEGVDQYFVGPTAIVFCMQDEIVSSKMLTNFAKEHEGLKIKVGLLNKKILNASEIELISKLPNRNVLLSQLVNVMQFPVLKFVGFLGEPIQKLLSIVSSKGG